MPVNRKTPFRFKVGTVTIDKPLEGSYSYETAAWFTNYELEPGTYDVYGTYERDYYMPERMRLKLETDSVPGVITKDHTPSLFGGVAYGPTTNPQDGKPMSQSLAVTPYHINGKDMQFNLEAAYITQKDDFGRLDFVPDEEHPEWQALMVARDRHKFIERLSSSRIGSTDYRGIAEKNGLLEDKVVDECINMGPFYFESIIRLDAHMRIKLGYGIVESGVPLTEVAEKFKGHAGEVSTINHKVMKELITEYDLSAKQNKGLGSDLHS